MASKSAPTSADYERLKAQFAELRALIESLREQMREHAKNAQIQFQRIAEIQAVLDEEGRHDAGIGAPIYHARPDGDGNARSAPVPKVQARSSRGRPIR